MARIMLPHYSSTHFYYKKGEPLVSKYIQQATHNRHALVYDPEYQKRLTALTNLTKAFKNNNVNWALTCSAELFLDGIVDNFHDLDIVIAPENCSSAISVLNIIGSRKKIDKDPSRKRCFYATQFAEYVINGIDVDVICEFGVTTFGVEYCYHFKQSQVHTIEIGSLEIPCIAPEAQYLLYSMMCGWQPQRAFKRDLLMEYLMAGNVHYEEILKDGLEQNLPYQLIEGVEKILKKL